MKNYSKVGGRKGMPGYRTPSGFKTRVHIKVSKHKISEQNTFLRRHQGKANNQSS